MAPLQGKLLYSLVVALTCNAFLLIGYDNGVFGGLISQPAFKATFGIHRSTILGLVTSIFDAGCFLGCLLTFVIGERLGRRRTMFLGAIVMLIGALLQATSYSLAQIIVARITSGIGMGLINSTAPVYQSEFSPKASRGIYGCAELSTLNFGIFLSYWIDYAFSGHPGSYAWRVPVILQSIFIITIGVLSAILPESPRWLIAHNRGDEALQLFKRLYSYKLSQEEIDEKYQRIRTAVNIEDQAQSKSFMSLIEDDDIGSRRRLVIACAIQFFQQIGGINGLIYYAGPIFSTSLGFSSHFSALMSGFLFTWFFVASFIPWFLIDRIGRRPLLLSMISLMSACLAVEAAMVYQIQFKTSISHSAGAGAAAMLFIFMGAFTIGFQGTVWVYAPEILPLRLRQRGTAIASSANWISNFIVVQVTPPGITNIGWRYYIIYAVFNACFVPVIYFFFPETKGLELEDVDQLFARGELLEIVHMKDSRYHNAAIQIEESRASKME